MFRSLKPLRPYLWRYRWGFVCGAFSVLLHNGIAVLFPQVLKLATDGLNTKITHQKIETYALLLVAIAAGKGIFQYLSRWILIGISREIEFDLRNDLFQHLEKLSHSYYQRTRTGDIMARATNDLNAVRMLLGPGIMYLANTLVFMAGALFFMVHISPRLTLYTFIPLPAASIIVQYFGRRIHQRFERIQAQFSDISARAQENFSGARLVRAYAQEDAETALFERSNSEYIARSLKLVRLMGMLWPTLEGLLGLAVIMVLFFGAREVLQHRMSVGQFIAYQTYMLQLTWPMIALGWVINIFMRGTASLERIHEMMREVPEVTDKDSSLPKEIEIKGEVEFRGLNFSFGDTPVLRNVSLKVPAGTSLAIVGPTGSGKTTLVSLIPRIYDPALGDAQAGTVLLDGRSVQEYPLGTLRRNIGFVPQETFLFSESVRENIAFGVPSATEDEVRRAAQIAHIATDIEEFPLQYATLVGERGLTLSGGQKQRTAIARAVIRDPKVLVLDDALASVDTYTEERILEQLRQVMEGRTTIFISHRISTVRNADKIAVLHDGSVVEYGTHDELMERNGYYTDLFQKQLLEEELARV